MSLWHITGNIQAHNCRAYKKLVSFWIASQATNDKSTICHSSPTPPVILNEVKNRIETKGKPTAEILHFVQNDIGKVTFFSCHFSPD